MEKMRLDQTDEIAGLDKDSDAVWADYPIDTMLIRTETRTVHDVIRRINQKSFVMDPDFQRAFIWNDEKQSKLIESVLMRIPLPVFYLAEDKEGRMVVVDGLQRLSTFKRYVENEFALKLNGDNQLNKMRFNDLEPKLKNRIEDCNLILYVIDAKAPERAKLDIFERVNGGVPLTRQQMRNCLFMGKATAFLKKEAESKVFLTATGNSLRSDTMRDREFVNRFCAFELLSSDTYKGDMDDFLARALEQMNNLTDNGLQELSDRFRVGLENNLIVFGKHAFRKFSDVSDSRSVINASIWDVMSTGLANFSKQEVSEQAARLRFAFVRLLTNYKFEESITYATNAVVAVRQRFEVSKRMFREVFND